MLFLILTRPTIESAIKQCVRQQRARHEAVLRTAKKKKKNENTSTLTTKKKQQRFKTRGLPARVIRKQKMLSAFSFSFSFFVVVSIFLLLLFFLSFVRFVQSPVQRSVQSPVQSPGQTKVQAIFDNMPEKKGRSLAMLMKRSGSHGIKNNATILWKQRCLHSVLDASLMPWGRKG